MCWLAFVPPAGTRSVAIGVPLALGWKVYARDSWHLWGVMWLLLIQTFHLLSGALSSLGWGSGVRRNEWPHAVLLGTSWVTTCKERIFLFLPHSF